MAAGIEQFRSVASSNVNRIRLDAPGGSKIVQAPLKFRQRRVAQHRQDHAASAGNATENVAVRQSFYRALTKAYGADVAARAIRASGSTATNFSQSTGRLSSRTVARVLDTAKHLKLGRVRTNKAAARQFVAAGHLGQAVLNHAHTNNVPAQVFDQRVIKAAFYRAVMNDPGFGSQALTDNQIQQIARDAIASVVDQGTARFTEAFPHLSRVNNPPYADSGTFFPDMQQNLSMGGALGGEPASFRAEATQALAALANTPALLAQAPFDPNAVDRYQQGLQRHWVQLDRFEQRLTVINPNTLGPNGVDLRDRLLQEITHQKTQLQSRRQFCQEYRDNDPLSEKQFAYNKVLWAQGAAVQIDKTIHDLGLPLGNAVRTQLETSRDRIVNDATRDWQNASAHNRVDMTFTKWQKFKLFLGKRIDKPHPAMQKADIKDQLKAALRTAAQDPAATTAISKGLEKARDKAGKSLKGSRLTAMNTVQSWQPIQRNMVVSKGGVTRTYRSDITPASQTPTRVGRLMQQDGVHGISAGTKKEPENARNLQVSKLVDPSNNRVLHQSIRHGVLDPWQLPKTERQPAANRQADQVLHLAVQSDTRFKNALMAAAANPAPPPAFTHTHVNFNHTTPVDRPLPGGDYNEASFTDHQFKAFEMQNGNKIYTVDTPAANDVQMPPVTVDTITFSFGTNDLAQEPSTLAKPLNKQAWKNVYEHDEANLRKLIGSLEPGTRPGGHIGRVLDQLENAAPPPLAPPNWAQQRAKLVTELREQVDMSRRIFTSGDYREGKGDLYKMSRHTMRAVDLSNQALQLIGNSTDAITQSHGCKSNKDRAGMADVEVKAQAIIEDMGGRVVPNTTMQPDDQAIYNTVLTSSGQDTNQQWNTGLPGSKNAGETAERINNPDAQSYATGFAKYVKA